MTTDVYVWWEIGFPAEKYRKSMFNEIIVDEKSVIGLFLFTSFQFLFISADS